jgi:oligopeptide/dipeptide ABC transporter ATP-binding protein
MKEEKTILTVQNLKKYYPIRSSFFYAIRKRDKRWVRAVDNVSLNIDDGETLGLIGESGSGKTTLGRTITLLQLPTSGEIIFKGQDLTKLNPKKLRLMRKKIQIVFQNPTSSLDPRQRVKKIVSEPLRAFGGHESPDVVDRIIRILDDVGLSKDSINKFPHEMSGGQRQRISIARSLILGPELIVLDEPTSALDSSVQGQILNLLRKIQEERKLSYLFITHNVNVVKYMADRVAVMYAGKIVEIGTARDVLERPLHPYTSALIASVPKPDPEAKREQRRVKTNIPLASGIFESCRYNLHCKYAEEICRKEEPKLREIKNLHWAACHFADTLT